VRAAGTAVGAWSRRAAVLPRVVRVRGHGADARVRFDEHGVPHVRAETEADAFRALGVCHALDRGFQMDVTRRLLRGRLSEVVGERPLGARALPPLSGGTTTDLDRLMRVLSLLPAAERALAAGTDEERYLLDAYVEGVNAGLFRARRPTPPDVALLGRRIEPWTALDSCLLAKGMAVGLSFKWRAGPVCAAMAAALAGKPGHLRGVLPRSPDASAPAIADADPAARGLDAALGALGWHAPPAGSNAWVVGGGRTASGFPIVASDPHLELSLPPVWYLASVVGGRYACVGATMPGTPGVVIGRTPTVAWGLTNAMLDDGDLWAEELDGTGTRHLVDGAWRDLVVETHEILRRDAAPALFRVRRTHRGPILTDAFPGYAGKPLSLRLALHETTGEMPSFLRLGRARTAADVEAAAVGYGSPAQNLVYATTEGVAGYLFLGAVPARAPGAGDPALPLDGTRSDTDWLGWHPPAATPRFRLPRDGAVVTANDAHTGRGDGVYLSCLYEPGYRAARLRALLDGRTGTTCADHAAIQMDDHSLGAEAFRRTVLLPVAEAVRAARPAVARLLDRCLLATGRERAEDVGPALLHLAHHHLVLRVFSPHLGDDLVRRWMGCVNLVEERLLEAFRDPESPWAPPAARPALVADALEAAGRDLAARGLASDAPWGAVHALTLRHAMSSVPLLGDVWTRGPFPMPGGPYTVQAGQYLHDRPAAMIVGASYRQVVDLADPEGTARFVVFGGQSGHVGSRHYDDLTARWRRNDLLPMRLERWPEKGRDLVVRAG
jgi:penicillin amidase